MESERRRELPCLMQNTLLRILMRLHLHGSWCGPGSLITKFAPNSDLHRFSDPFSYLDNSSRFLDYTLLADSKASLPQA